MFEAVTFTGQEDMLVGNLHVLKCLLLHILVYLVLDDQLRYRRERVGHVDLQVILMAVQSEDGNFLRIRGGHDARNIAIGIKRQVNSTRLSTLDVKRHHLHPGILLTRHGILVGVTAGIVVILFPFGCHAFEELHRILGHISLVVAYPDYLARIGREHHR